MSCTSCWFCSSFSRAASVEASWSISSAFDRIVSVALSVPPTIASS